MNNNTKEFKVYEFDLCLSILEDINIKEIRTKVNQLIDKSFVDSNMLEYHKNNAFKFYCFGLPLVVDSKNKFKYSKGSSCNLKIRTINGALVSTFLELGSSETKAMKVTDLSITILKDETFIKELVTVTPAIIKLKDGYWKEHISLEEYLSRLKINLIKKYQMFTGSKLNEDFVLLDGIEFLNDKPLNFRYKNVNLLGDKLKLTIANNDTAQMLARMALGTGVFEMNSRGAGFVKAKRGR